MMMMMNDLVSIVTLHAHGCAFYATHTLIVLLYRYNDYSLHRHVYRVCVCVCVRSYRTP